MDSTQTRALPNVVIGREMSIESTAPPLAPGRCDYCESTEGRYCRNGRYMCVECVIDLVPSMPRGAIIYRVGA